MIYASMMKPKELTLFFAWCLLKMSARTQKKTANSAKCRLINPNYQKTWMANKLKKPVERKKHDDKTRAWKKLHPEKVSEMWKNWSLKNPGRIKIREAKDLNFKIARRLRKRIWAAVVDGEKSDLTFALVGCSIDFFKKHIETQFRPGMSWENYGPAWHIDHKRPCASFDLSKSEQQYECFHYTNLQPLWAKENLSKGAKCA